jgi:hypothetical protein
VARRRGRRRSVGQLSRYLRSLPYGLLYMAIGGGLLAMISAFGQGISQYLNINMTMYGTNVSLPLGSAVNVIVGFGGLLALLYGLYKVLRVRL